MIPDIHLGRVNNDLLVLRGLSPATSRGLRVLVVGGGVTGLTTAWALLDAGYDVTVVAERWTRAYRQLGPSWMRDTMSLSLLKGGRTNGTALPLRLRGPYGNGRQPFVVDIPIIISLEKSKKWCMTSYRIFEKLHEWMPPAVEELEHGVRMRMANFFFHKELEGIADDGQLQKWHEILAMSHEIRGVRRDPNLIQRHEISPHADLVDSYQHMCPVVDADAYMRWLQVLLTMKGASFGTEKICGDLLSQEEELLYKYGADIIVNASGLGSYELAGDQTVYPLRGALIRVVNDGKRFPKITEALVVPHDDSRKLTDGSSSIVFIVPRNDDILILGGIVQAYATTLDLTLESPEVRRMRAICNDFVPGLEFAEYDSEAPLVQGLRPCRGTNVRVERETRRKDSKIIHSYGHGGSGFTLSFGCASEVISLVKALEKDAAATRYPMSHL